MGVDNLNAELQFIDNDTTDTEWANSTYYSIFGGDYNINTLRGSIASTIMKLQAWMPQATIILCTPAGGWRSDVQNIAEPDLYPDMQPVSNIIREMSDRLSIPLIDVHRWGGNSLNCVTGKYYGLQSDGAHPYGNVGQQRLANVMVGGLKTIYPLPEELKWIE